MGVAGNGTVQPHGLRQEREGDVDGDGDRDRADGLTATGYRDGSEVAGPPRRIVRRR